MFRNEYFLADYIYKIGNFNVDFINSGFIGDGYTDIYNADWADGINGGTQKDYRISYATSNGGSYTYDFCLIPLVGKWATFK